MPRRLQTKPPQVCSARVPPNHFSSNPPIRSPPETGPEPAQNLRSSYENDHPEPAPDPPGAVPGLGFVRFWESKRPLGEGECLRALAPEGLEPSTALEAVNLSIHLHIEYLPTFLPMCLSAYVTTYTYTPCKQQHTLWIWPGRTDKRSGFVKYKVFLRFGTPGGPKL